MQLYVEESPAYRISLGLSRGYGGDRYFQGRFDARRLYLSLAILVLACKHAFPFGCCFDRAGPKTKREKGSQWECMIPCELSRDRDASAFGLGVLDFRGLNETLNRGIWFSGVAGVFRFSRPAAHNTQVRTI